MKYYGKSRKTEKWKRNTDKEKKRGNQWNITRKNQERMKMQEECRKRKKRRENQWNITENSRKKEKWMRNTEKEKRNNEIRGVKNEIFKEKQKKSKWKKT